MGAVKRILRHVYGHSRPRWPLLTLPRGNAVRSRLIIPAKLHVMGVSANSYATHGMTSVGGWLSKESALLICTASQIQLDAAVEGAVAEIGVHHGRLFVLLALLRQPGEGALAIDLFERQELNVDRSGKGDREIFRHNLERFGVDLDMVHVVPKSSMDISPLDILDEVGHIRLFSIDGGHTTEVAENDLRLAEQVLSSGGIVILDDVFTSIFPGVSAALAQYLLTDGKLVPFAVSIGKTLLTDEAHVGSYMNSIKNSMKAIYLRDEIFYGNKVAIFRNFPPLNERVQLRIAHSAVYKRARDGHAVESIRPILLKLLGR
jgi:hypothetical protein